MAVCYLMRELVRKSLNYGTYWFPIRVFTLDLGYVYSYVSNSNYLVLFCAALSIAVHSDSDTKLLLQSMG